MNYTRFHVQSSVLETPLTFYFIKLCENSLKPNMTFSGHRVAR